jgi:hypothetical protein
VSTQGYEEELRSERSYVAGLYVRLDAERARVKAAFNAALRGTGGTPMERDFEVRALAKEAKRLNVADNGLCFGRLDTLSGEHSYIGRIGIFDEENEYEPVLLDWRAPAARPFYVATGANPENMRRRRQFLTRGRQVVSAAPAATSGGTRHCSLRSTRRGVPGCATSWRRSRPSRTRSSGSITPGCW